LLTGKSGLLREEQPLFRIDATSGHLKQIVEGIGITPMKQKATPKRLKSPKKLEPTKPLIRTAWVVK
jgi:hypothetical protein